VAAHWRHSEEPQVRQNRKKYSGLYAQDKDCNKSSSQYAGDGQISFEVHLNRVGPLAPGPRTALIMFWICEERPSSQGDLNNANRNVVQGQH
jgi:hypothetical protein